MTRPNRQPTAPDPSVAAAFQAQHDAAHAACKPMVLRGLGLADFSTANPCWVDTLPICPAPKPYYNPPVTVNVLLRPEAVVPNCSTALPPAYRCDPSELPPPFRLSVPLCTWR